MFQTSERRPTTRRPSPTSATTPLTLRERDVVALVVDGLTNPEIGARLVISPRTVQSHVAAAMRKLEARSRTQLAVAALRTGVVPLYPVVDGGLTA